jgi:hypothetical protein
VRKAMIGWMVVAAILLGMSIGRAADGDETTFAAQVSSAEHDATVIAKPGTDLHRFLSRQNGKNVRITLTLANTELSKLQRLER